MNKLFLLVLLLAGLSAARATPLDKAKLSPQTRIYLEAAREHPEAMLPGYVYKRTAAGGLLLSALIQVGNVSEASVRQLGVFIGTKAGDVWTVQIPPARLAAFTALPGIAYIQLDEPVFPALDSVRKVTRADSVQAGINLPKHFSGQGVVMGVIDIGFDYTHPLFYDTLGNTLRIRKVWEQQTGGTPPAGYSYGRELTAPGAILAAATDNNGQSHGTHVAGIAAGSGIGSSTGDDRFRGLAFGTDVVLVGITPPPGQWTNTGLSDIIDGMKYIFDYAASVGKPAVANLSWGCTIGPHDGRSLFSRACDNLTGAGRIFVCSAGNTGGNNIHLQKKFTAADTLVHTFVSFAGYLPVKKTWLDVWGDSAQSFCLAATLYSNGAPASSTGFICLDNAVHNTYLIGADGDTCFVTLSTSSADVNGKPRIFLNIYNKSSDGLFISAKGNSGKINMWEGYVEGSTGYYGALTNGNLGWATAGDINMTISDISATRSAIAVGAYTARNLFVNVSGSTQAYASYPRGRITSFSSRGPAADSTVKPDITAPGFLVASGVNSYDAGFSAGGGSYDDVYSTFQKNGRTYSYAMLSGTSMSSPVVSGITALMLEANPALTPAQVRDIMAQTAITDVYTGAIPASGTNTWGHGKVNAYGAIRKVIRDLSVGHTTGKSLQWCIYPNPSNGSYLVACTADKEATANLEISDMTGRTVLRQPWVLKPGINRQPIRLSGIAKGYYMTRLILPEGISGIKTLIE